MNARSGDERKKAKGEDGDAGALKTNKNKKPKNMM